MTTPVVTKALVTTPLGGPSRWRALLRHPLTRLSLAGAGAGGAFWAYDTAFEGERVNRSMRAVWAAAYTLVQYKFVYSNTEKPVDKIHRDVAEAWLRAVRKNGGLYSKLAQGVASMNHVLPREYLDILGVIQDRAPTEPWEEIEKLLREEYGGQHPFKTLEREAVASASIAQVHVGTLEDGTKVAVKIQKSKIAKQIDNDLFMYRTLTYLIERLFELPIYWMVPYTIEQLRKETNFINEADNAERADALAQSDPVLRRHTNVPKVYREISTRRVLVTEWIDGCRVTDMKRIKEMGLSPAQVMDVVTRYFSHQLFVTGHLHADPHAGNLFVRVNPDPKKPRLNVVIIDHGLYCDMSEQFRKSYADLWVAIVTMNEKELERVARSWGITDHELFASFQLFKPYNAKGVKVTTPGTSRPVTSGEGNKITRKELLAFQLSVKDRIKKMLSDSSVTPPELSLVGRNLNLVRSLNKALDSPVNRAKIMAEYAAMGCSANLSPLGKHHDLSDHHGLMDRLVNFSSLSFTIRLFLIDLLFSVSELVRKVNRAVFGVDTGGFESALERQMEKSVEERFGFKVRIQGNEKFNEEVDLG